MAQYGSFETNIIENDKQIIKDGGGVTSCLGVRLDNVIRYIEKFGVLPNYIDSTQQFLLYADEEPQDVSMYLLGDYVPDNDLPKVNFFHYMQFSWYDEIDLPNISKLSNCICPLSDAIINKSEVMIDIMDDRTAILYRGNDKGVEIKRTQYQSMEGLANESGSTRFLVQTDEEDFYRWFKDRFPNTICFDEVPRINKNPDGYVMPQKGKKVEFAINFLAALKAISSSEKLIMNTGNTGLWAAIFRGTTKNIYQYHGNFAQWRKL